MFTQYITSDRSVIQFETCFSNLRNILVEVGNIRCCMQNLVHMRDIIMYRPSESNSRVSDGDPGLRLGATDGVE